MEPGCTHQAGVALHSTACLSSSLRPFGTGLRLLIFLQLRDDAFLNFEEIRFAQVEMVFLEVHVALLGDGDEMDVRVRHLQTDDGHPYPFAGQGFLEGHRHLLGKDHHGGNFIVVEMKDIVNFPLGDDQRVAFCDRVDVEEGEEMLVFRNLVARDFPFHYSCEYGSHGFAVFNG